MNATAAPVPHATTPTSSAVRRPNVRLLAGGDRRAGTSLPGLRVAAGRSRQRNDRPHIPGDGGGVQLPRGQLDDEGGAGGVLVICPANDASRLTRESREPHTGEPGETTLDGDRAARLVDHIEVLMEPDRDTRLNALHEPVGDPALGLGQSMRARVVEAGERSPAPGEVAIEIDSVSVATSAGRDAVGVQVGNDPKIELGRRRSLRKPVGNRDARSLIPVDATNDQRTPTGVEVTSLDRDDRPSVDRAAEHDDAPPTRIGHEGADAGSRADERHDKQKHDRAAKARRHAAEDRSWV